jgi:hypothetical protein
MTRKNIRIRVTERDPLDMQRLMKLVAAQARTASRQKQVPKGQEPGGQL